MSETNENIIVYGTSICSDCMRSKRFFEEKGISYQWVNIENDAEAVAYVEKVNEGRKKVPTIIFPDNSVLVEPTNAELAKKLGL